MSDFEPGRLLQSAAIYNNVELMESLLEGPEKNNVNMQDPFGRTALYTSVTNNSFECSELLLKNGANPNIACGLQCGGMTPLHAAALDNKDRFIQLLVKFNGDLNQVDASGEKPLDLAEKNRSTNCIDYIKSQLEACEQKKNALQREFLDACLTGNIDRAHEIITTASFTDEQVMMLVNGCGSEDGHDLLYCICRTGSADLCEFLLSLGAEVRVGPASGLSPLHITCLVGNLKCVDIILKYFPDLVAVPTSEGSYPIHLACLQGHLDIVKLLLNVSSTYVEKLNASKVSTNKTSEVVNVRDGRRCTPLHIAVFNNRLNIVRYLLSIQLHGEHNRNSAHGKTDFESDLPRRFPSDKKSDQSSETAIAVDIEAEDCEGHTALHIAIMGDQEGPFADCAVLLLQNKADPNRQMITAEGISFPLMEVLRRSNKFLLGQLLKYGAKDDDLSVITAAVNAGDDEIIGTIIQTRVYSDSDYKLNSLAFAQEQHELEKLENLEEEVCKSTTSSASFLPLMLNWHSLTLKHLTLDWVQKACAYHLKRINLSCPDWALSRPLLGLFFITRIDISENRLSALPGFLFQMPSLHILNASFNEISTIEPCTTELSRSRSGKFRQKSVKKENYNRMDSSEDVILNCPYLEEIDLQHNLFSTLDKFLFKLPNLKRLNVSHNKISSLPFEMWTSPSLVDLNLSHNLLDQLPYSVDQLNDRSLILWEENGCERNFGTGVSVCRSGSPSMFRNSINEDSVSGIFSDMSIKQMDLERSENSVDLPTVYVNRWQDKVKVKLASYRDGDGMGWEKQSQLKELNMSHNSLEEVPLGLSCLVPNLEKLFLSHNRLTWIGQIEMYPANLQTLDLSNNQISNDLDSSQSNAKMIADVLVPGRGCFSPFQLRSTSASYSLPPRMISPARCYSAYGSVSTISNAFSMSMCLHSIHRQLEKLRVLKLDNNRLQTFQIFCSSEEKSSKMLDDRSDSLGSLSTSRSNSPMAKKRISTLRQESVLEKRKQELLFPNLTMLDISHNSILALTKDICHLVNLAELKISHNRIKELPPELGLLKKMWCLDFSSCPVDETLRSLLGEKARKTQAVLGYLKSIKDEAVPFNRMKLMLVGRQGIGKTSLLNQLPGEKGKYTHWGARMNHTIKDKDAKGDNISTVGVDIGDYVIQRNGEKIVFSTWDFGGQKEYYATHQYFLSKRSLYLVVWKLTDGEKGVNEIMRWLVNIQARAPNSPVIIVGTHKDLVRKNFQKAFIEEMGALIERKYMNVNEPDKLGLPRVFGHVEVSCKGGILNKSNIPQLADMIWRAVSEKQPGNKGTRLLDQKVPASYIRLQDVVRILARERKQLNKDPVLNSDQYKHLVIEKMEELYGASFQDTSELSQATQFLHENGILLHYDDVNLQDIYFLDPQWLCDMLACIITIREINSLAKSGIMKTEDLKILFKGVAFHSEDIKTYIINLLHKFEVALLWDSHHLLIPSLLPTEDDLLKNLANSEVEIPLCGGECLALNRRRKKRVIHTNVILGQSTFYISSEPQHFPTNKTNSSSSNLGLGASTTRKDVPIITNIVNPAVSIVRLYVMSYFPSGFWPRLITRLLGDKTFYQLTLSMYDFSKSLTSAEEMLRKMDDMPYWRCWQTGVELNLFGFPIMRLKEVSGELMHSAFDYNQFNLKIKDETEIFWSSLSINDMSILEILIPNESLDVRGTGIDGETTSCTVFPNMEVVASLLTKTVDRIDTLLEDWYPDIGIRFNQNSRGMYLITRLVPCTRCLIQQTDLLIKEEDGSDGSFETISHSEVLNVDPSFDRKRSLSVLAKSPNDLSQFYGMNNCKSNSCSKLPDHDVKSSSLSSSPQPLNDHNGENGLEDSSSKVVHCYLIEQCLQVAQQGKIVACPCHGNLGPYFVASDNGFVHLAHIAPDTVFQDINSVFVIDHEVITRGKFLGKGAFGAVYAGTMLDKLTNEMKHVAMKMLQPVKPTDDAPKSLRRQYQMEKARWDKEPMKNCCEAYLIARKELTILLSLSHNHVVPLLGVSITPLCILLSLAPLGCLNDHLKEFHRAGARLPIYVISDLIVQVASALKYLHSKMIIYRDLKSENVLVWSLVKPHDDSGRKVPINVKLADYGVSRVVLPTGTKGFAGTPPFMAPEIILHNGEETYTEKVDCFSFAMLIYELLMLKSPYEGATTIDGNNMNLKGHVLAGGRPTISNKEVLTPTNILDLMTLCWSRDPNDRPSASEIESFAASPEFCSLYNAIMLDDQVEVVCASTSQCSRTTEYENLYAEVEPVSSRKQTDVWLSVKSSSPSSSPTASLLVYMYEGHECVHSKKLKANLDVVICMCVVNDHIWCATSSSMVHIFRQSDFLEVLKFNAASRSTIHCMTYARFDNRVYVILENGHIVICRTNLPSQLGPSYDPVITECPGNGKSIHCIVSLGVDCSFKALWCGQNQAKICIWNLDETLGNVQTINHFATEENRVDTVNMVIESTDPTRVYSYVYPGTVVYSWDSDLKCISERLDLINQLPEADLPDHMLSNEKFKAGRCQVTSMNVIGSYLYVGTTFGCLVVVDRYQMSPVFVCRPHGSDFPNITAILPITFPEDVDEEDFSATTVDSDVPSKITPCPRSFLVTIGKGYRDLVEIALSRYQKYEKNPKDRSYILLWSDEEWPV